MKKPRQSIRFNILRDMIALSIQDAFNPYSSSSPPFNREEYKKNLMSCGFLDNYNLDDSDQLFEAFTEDIRDDHSNCGGLALHRINEALQVMGLVDETQKEHIANFMATWLVDDIMPEDGYELNWPGRTKYL